MLPPDTIATIRPPPARPARAAATASAPAPSVQEGRFSMTPTQGGFLRLDKETGAVSFCTVDAGLSVCRGSADERARGIVRGGLRLRP